MFEKTLTDRDSALLQGMIDALDYYVLLIDENHRIILANKATSSAFGLESSQLIGQFCPKAIHHVDGSFPGCPLEIAVKSGNVEQVEMFDSGYQRWMDSRIYPTDIRTQSGLRTYLHLVFDITEKRNTEERLKDTLAKLRTSLGGIIQVVQEIVEKRDPFTAGHQSRVSDLARSIALEMNLPEDRIDAVRMAGIIHDIGKIAVPAEILSKPGILSESEFGLIKEHSRAGYEILKKASLPWPIADIILQHHERLDGSGYPQGLKGDAIVLEARILAVADVVEAMASHRPYRPALEIDRALEEISEKSGLLYDPTASDACSRLFKEKGYRLKD
jgi:putative nucleotidyltransferase with HDIG domain/PAS domain S-box-containing protein